MEEFQATYEKVFDRLLVDISHCNVQGDLCAYWPYRGLRYQDELMVIGRSPNGGDDPFSLTDCSTEDGRKRINRQARTKAEPGSHDDPLRWVPDQGHSRFWQVTRDVVRGLTSEDGNWCDHLVWTNLAKIAPAAGGNPQGKLRIAQGDSVLRLIPLEIAHFAPKRVMVMTGEDLDWFDWFDRLATKLGLTLEKGTGEVLQVAREDTRVWVVTKRPDRTKPDGTTNDAFVRDVLRAFQPLVRSG